MLENYIVVDLEMTGLNPKTDRILEIGAVKVKEKRVQDTFSMLIRPECNLNEKIVELTGITDDMASLGEELDTAVNAFLKFAEDFVWVGHNVQFDYKYIKQWEVNHRIEKAHYSVDTLKIARKCLPHLEKKTLDFLCNYYGIERTIRHRALDDAAANQSLYEIFEQNFLNEEPDLFVGKLLQYKVKRQAPATLRQKKYLKDLIEYHRISLDIPIEHLSRSDASRLTDRLIRQYGKR